MRNPSLLGIVLVLIGVGILLFGHFTYSETRPVADFGPVHTNSHEEHHVSIPAIAGIVVAIAVRPE